MPETVVAKLVDLSIDEENPRISQPNEGQRAALQTLAEHQSKKLLTLASDIVQHGISPSDLPIVMESGSPGRYRVLEGNRRLAALKALENPEWLDGYVGSGVLKQMRRLAKTYAGNPIEDVACALVKDRDEAHHWIELKHTGENSGAGIVQWGAEEAARFKKRAPEVHTQALDFLERRGDLTTEQRRKVPTSTLRRLLSSPVVRQKLAVDAHSGALFRLADEGKVAKALMYVVSDLASGKTKVKDVYTKELRSAYAKKLPKSVVVRPTIPRGEGVSIGATPTASARRKKPRARTGKKRDKLIPTDCVLNVTSGRVREMEIELRKLSLENFTNAVSVLFRVFVELSIDDYIDRNAVPDVSEKSNLGHKLSKSATDMVSRKKLTGQQAKPVRRAAQKDSFLAPSVSLMHQYVHNKHVFPAPGDLRAGWDSLQPFVAAMWAD